MKFFRSASLVCLISSSASAFVTPRPHLSTRVRQILQAAPGVEVANPDDVKKALANDNTIIIDARGLDEIQKSGYFKPTKPSQQWLNIPCSITEAPLLTMAAEDMLRDKSTPIIVHCASGKRSTLAKKVLDDMGYENVLNAGGFPGDMEPFMEK